MNISYQKLTFTAADTHKLLGQPDNETGERASNRNKKQGISCDRCNGAGDLVPDQRKHISKSGRHISFSFHILFNGGDVYAVFP